METCRHWCKNTSGVRTRLILQPLSCVYYDDSGDCCSSGLDIWSVDNCPVRNTAHDLLCNLHVFNTFLICASYILEHSSAAPSPNVRLNGAILMDLERQGIDISKHFSVIAEGKGLTMDLYTMKRYGDVLGAGHANNNPVWLPADLTQLQQFLSSDSIHVLIAFTEHTKIFAYDVRDILARTPAPCLASTPPQKHAEIRLYITRTPSKNNKRWRIEDDGDCDY
ncbi:hypothetical protein EC991_000449 [Linnemannia zychae]|nr:hypothetical protein EC991_000449 [Linnemannia zychae]